VNADVKRSGMGLVAIRTSVKRLARTAAIKRICQIRKKESANAKTVDIDKPSS
jgi:hypothetical protein